MDRVMSTPEGVKYRVVDVAGRDRCCEILAPIALNMFRENIPLEDIVSSVSGNLTDDMMKYVPTLRGKVVEMSRVFFSFADGEELADFDDVVDNPMWVIMARGMWEKVMLCFRGQFDGRAFLLMGKVLPLDGIRIVKHDNGILAPCDVGVPLPSGHCPMVLHDGYGHFKALLHFRETSESEASGGDSDGESEASSGTDEDEAMSETTESESTGGADE
ncbi:hypothetical protein Esi_0053_0012 [Ectocarpus siliculosus]|uniref:Uncharacterized protein n=1 Tax=Ectocarpus siliculosus TaxID=2880 RepID=D8LPN8_ECTSI|nr:hypothetical protein Esi_0053_0012 [Ectocarpus siliculosus]|eukprot:CBN77343.1 hypothetical protein Esi_0053_0012 [Ectocarpus siliculosus]